MEKCGKNYSKYKAKQAEYNCIHCKVALVEVLFRQDEPVQTKDKDLKIARKPPSRRKKQIDLRTSKSQTNFSNLRELYRHKYIENGDNTPEEESKPISGELVRQEMGDLINAAVDEDVTEFKTIQTIQY